MIRDNTITSAVYTDRNGDKQLLRRGTPEWDQREHARQQADCRCLGFGPIIGNGKLAKVDASLRNK